MGTEARKRGRPRKGNAKIRRKDLRSRQRLEKRLERAKQTVIDLTRRISNLNRRLAG